MAVIGTYTQADNKDGKKVPAFLAEFTNGTLEQLEELATYLDREGLEIPKDGPKRKLAVIKIGIAWLESLKERDKEKVNQ